MAASYKGSLQVVQALLTAQADVNAKDTTGVTALAFASQNGHLEVVQALLAAGAEAKPMPRAPIPMPLPTEMQARRLNPRTLVLQIIRGPIRWSYPGIVDQ